MRRRLQIALALTLAWPTTGCVMAARHLAKEANRSTIQSKGRHRFPAGTPVEKARADLVAQGYRCLDMPGDRKTKAHVSCWPTTHRTDAFETFLVGGNWRWDLYAQGPVLTKLHVASARNGMRRQTEALAKANVANPTPPAADSHP